MQPGRASPYADNSFFENKPLTLLNEIIWLTQSSIRDQLVSEKLGAWLLALVAKS